MFAGVLVTTSVVKTPVYNLHKFPNRYYFCGKNTYYTLKIWVMIETLIVLGKIWEKKDFYCISGKTIGLLSYYAPKMVSVRIRHFDCP